MRSNALLKVNQIRYQVLIVVILVNMVKQHHVCSSLFGVDQDLHFKVSVTCLQLRLKSPCSQQSQI